MKSMVADENGDYKIKFVRFDVFNETVSESTCVDLSYFAIHDDLGEILDANSDISEITLVKNGTASEIDTSTGAVK